MKKLGFKGCLDFGYYNYHIAEPILETHHHKDSIEICYYLKGEQYYQIEGELFKLKGNDFLIVPPNVPHGSGAYPEDIGELFWLQIQLCSNHNICFLPQNETCYLIDELRKKERKVLEGSFALKPILENLLKCLEAPEQPFNQIRINNLITQLLVETVLEGNKESQRNEESNNLQTIDTFITENMHRQVYVDELAALFSLSTAYFKNWFKQHFGIPPKTYINKIKIKHAKELMKTETQITKIAFALGFNSSQYFATVFKKHVGQSPKAYISLLLNK